MYLKSLGKQIIQVYFVGLIDPRDGCSAGIACSASARGHALRLVSALCLNSSRCGRFYVDFLIALPILEGSMLRCKVCYPLIRLANHLLVNTVFVVFLFVRIEEKIERRQIAERHVL